MGNLKEIRTRISSVGSTMQITSAMKMVSAAKLRRAQENVMRIRPYSQKMQEILENISSGDNDNVFAKKKDLKKILIIAISSNRGLCGAFNSNIAKQVLLLKKSIYKDLKVDVLLIGKKASDVLKSKNVLAIEDFNHVYDDLNFESVANIAEKYIDLFAKGEYDAIDLVYNQFKNAATQIVTTESFLPIKIEKNVENKSTLDYIYEPSKEYIVEDIIPKSLKTQLFKAVLDSYASEHGARMTSMHRATDNATEMLNDLQLTYNKARQAAITNEILEIVGGAEALNS